ncbi:MAG: hypothetical protein JMJ93_02300 [Synergistaceae bacterium]|nr:hypothetical protein [Synergistaceae bacterium]
MSIKRGLIGLFLCLLALTLWGAPLFAVQEYVLEKGQVYRVGPGGEKILLEDEEPGLSATNRGIYSWVLVDPELSEAMKGSTSGIYFFDEKEYPLGFLPFEGAAYCDVAFSPDGEMIAVNFGTDMTQDILLYQFDGFEKKATFRGLGSAAWIDAFRFVFTRDDASKGPRSDGLGQEGWISVVIYDAAMGEEIVIKEATETEDYLLCGVNVDEETLEILGRSVKTEEDWKDEEKIEDVEIVVPIPAAG